MRGLPLTARALRLGSSLGLAGCLQLPRLALSSCLADHVSGAKRGRGRGGEVRGPPREVGDESRLRRERDKQV